MSNDAFEPITDKEFEDRLQNELEGWTAYELVNMVPDIYSDVADYFTNDILEEYENDNSYWLTYDEVLDQFTDGKTIEGMREEYKYDDIALREDFNNYTDMLCESGEISEWAYNNWDNPF